MDTIQLLGHGMARLVVPTFHDDYAKRWRIVIKQRVIYLAGVADPTIADKRTDEHRRYELLEVVTGDTLRVQRL